MKMKKLSEEHYIICDDSEIKTGDWYYDSNDVESLIPIYQRSQQFADYSGCKKISHSTQPESLGVGWMQSVQPLFLSEVKELLGVVDKAFERYPVIENDKDHNDRNYYRRSAYYQALEDNKERKYIEEDMRKAMRFGSMRNKLTISELESSFQQLIQSLQPKTEWEVEFVDGKLKLKQ